MACSMHRSLALPFDRWVQVVHAIALQEQLEVATSAKDAHDALLSSSSFRIATLESGKRVVIERCVVDGATKEQDN